VRKTDRILQYLDGCSAGAPTGDIAAAIDDADGVDRTKALLTYLGGLGKVERANPDADRGVEAIWRITKEGREALADVADDAPSDSPRKVVHEAAPPKRAVKAAKAAKVAKAATPAKVARPAKTKGKPAVKRRAPRKLQRRTERVRPAPVAVVELTPPAPIVGRAIAIREDGAVLVLEDDVVVTTLIPEDALKIARVIQTLSGARA
jgi:hypothetical protein